MKNLSKGTNAKGNTDKEERRVFMYNRLQAIILKTIRDSVIANESKVYYE